MSNANYKTLFKATSLFGLVEVLRILLRIIVHKFSSYIFGASGYGVVGLIENATQLIASFTNFGINYTGLRVIAVSKNNDEITFKKTVKFVTVFCFFTGFLAALISILLSNYLSEYAFNNKDYVIWFIALGFYFVFNSYVQSKIIVLEAIQNINKLLSINVVVNITNAIIIIVSYYWFYYTGVFIALLLTSILNSFLFWYGTKEYNTFNVKLSNKEFKENLKKFTSSGILLALNTTIGFACFFVIRTYFKSLNDEAVLGYYHAANTLMVSYVGIVFIAISKFYFPKLSQLSKQKNDFNSLVNNQLEVCLLLLMPVIFILYLLGTIFIKILFSNQFLPIYEIFIFGLAAIFVKGYNYVVGYILLSKNNIKQYFFINAVSDILNLVLSILFYKSWGLYGIGLAILINYLLSAFYTGFYVKIKYGYVVDKQVNNMIFAVLVAVIIVIGTYFYATSMLFYGITFSIFMLSTIYSSYKLDQYLFEGKWLEKFKQVRKK